MSELYALISTRSTWKPTPRNSLAIPARESVSSIIAPVNSDFHESTNRRARRERRVFHCQVSAYSAVSAVQPPDALRENNLILFLGLRFVFLAGALKAIAKTGIACIISRRRAGAAQIWCYTCPTCTAPHLPWRAAPGNAVRCKCGGQAPGENAKYALS